MSVSPHEPRSSKLYVEITPEMIEAGSAVLCRMETALADEGFWAKEIYQAMERARFGMEPEQ